jgi:hypothetical protein
MMTDMNTQIAWLELGVPPLGGSLSEKEYYFGFLNNGFLVRGFFVKKFGSAEDSHDDGH